MALGLHRRPSPWIATVRCSGPTTAAPFIAFHGPQGGLLLPADFTEPCPYRLAVGDTKHRQVWQGCCQRLGFQFQIPSTSISFAVFFFFGGGGPSGRAVPDFSLTQCHL